MKNGTYYDDVFGLADVACKKDHPEVLDNTCMPALISGINAVETSDLVFEKDGESWSIDLVSVDPILRSTTASENKFAIHPVSYLSGDLAFLAYMMGKENFSPAWCNWCSLSKKEWQDGECIPVDENKLWCIDSIKAQVEANIEINYGPDTKTTDTRMKGVRRTPICLIPFKRIIFSVLHAAIGIGNNLITYLEIFIDAEIELISPEEIQLRNEKKEAKNLLSKLRQDKQVWMDSRDGTKLLQRTRARVKRIKKLMTIEDQDKPTLEIERKDCDARIIALVAVRETYSKKIRHEDKVLTEVNNKLKEKAQGRRSSESSVYNEIDKIFQTHGANRANYFGRKFQGIDIRKIMDQVSSTLFYNESCLMLSLTHI